MVKGEQVAPEAMKLDKNVERIMLSESQNIEYKESWRDEYLKWICGFANAHGGRIYIGVNDNKEVIGLPCRTSS